jgi:endonuclease-3
MADETEDRKTKAAAVAKRLARAIPEPEVELDFADAWQLLVATILAAQATDVTINKVTPKLFARYPTPAALARAAPSDVEEIVRSTGYYRQKAKAIMAASRAVAEEHGGVVPRTMEALVTLPGVARKTANVVLGSAYGIASGIVVDTHVTRVSQRLGLTTQKDATKIEADLMQLFPRRGWIDVSHRIVLHGRYVCTAKSPDCAACPLNEVCDGAGSPPKGTWTKRADAERARIPVRRPA